MGRSLLVGILLLAGCTRLNPAFDPHASGSDDVVDDEASSDVADDPDATEQGESASEAEAETESGEPDMLVCDFQPSDGLGLKFGDPAVLGGCPVAIDVSVKVIESGGTWIVENCSDGCGTCIATYPLAATPLDLVGHVPGPGSCLRIQASVPLGESEGACHWGALSIYDSQGVTPYVIAITKGSEPTSLGLQTLADLIPEPVKVGNCNCDEVGESHDCCYQAPTPPEFLAFPWNGLFLLPGDSAEIMVANQANLDYMFEVFQAQRLYACDSPERTLSWAVHAKLQ